MRTRGPRQDQEQPQLHQQQDQAGQGLLGGVQPGEGPGLDEGGSDQPVLLLRLEFANVFLEFVEYIFQEHA